MLCIFKRLTRKLCYCKDVHAMRLGIFYKFAQSDNTHGLLLESPFVLSSSDCWAVRAKNKAKTAVSVAVEEKPEVEIWR